MGGEERPPGRIWENVFCDQLIRRENATNLAAMTRTLPRSRPLRSDELQDDAVAMPTVLFASTGQDQELLAQE